MKSCLSLVLAPFIGAIIFVLVYSFCTNADTATKKNTETSQKPTEVTSATSDKNIIFFGNSLTAGYGLDDISTGFVALTQSRINSFKLNYHCVNAGLSGETTAGGAARVDWIIGQQPFEIFILELGGNDALRGIDPASSEKNLQTIIDKVKAKNAKAKIILAGMEAPRNMGKSYDNAFHAMYPTLAKKNNIALIPFILEKVGGVASLNQSDGIHPNVEGNKIVVENIWQVLRKEL